MTWSIEPIKTQLVVVQSFLEGEAQPAYVHHVCFVVTHMPYGAEKGDYVKCSGILRLESGVAVTERCIRQRFEADVDVLDIDQADQFWQDVILFQETLR